MDKFVESSEITKECNPVQVMSYFANIGDLLNKKEIT